MKVIRKKIIKIVSLICILTALTSCGSSKDIGKKDKGVDTDEIGTEEIVELNLWSYYPKIEEAIRQFETENPNIKINYTNFPYEEYEENYKASLIKEEGDADLLIIDSNDYGNFNSISGLEDLYKEEYSIDRYRDDFDSELWELGKSLDKSKLYGLAIGSAPLVTYYRKDILEEYGFPGEPEELAEFMKSKENWFEMASTLKKDGISLIQWYAELARITTSNMPYFDENFNYQRDTKEFEDVLKLAIEARSLGLAAFDDIWSESGKKLLQDGKFAMLYLGTWGSADLEALVPEQKGKWRVTSLPFGAYGWNNASIISMAENSKNKEAAWKFMEFYIFKYKDTSSVGSISGYLPFRNPENMIAKNDFLGGQDEYKVYYNSMIKTREYPVTPLDADTYKIWDSKLNEGMEEGYSTKKIMENIKNEIDSKFRETIKAFKE